MSFIRIDEIGNDSLGRVNKLLAGIQGGVYKATFFALKRAGDTAKTKAGQFAAAEYAITKREFMRNVNSKTQIKSESGGGVTSMSISYAGHVLPLLTFNTKFAKNARVQTQVVRNGGASTLERAFIANIFGSAGVYERVGASRFPVEQKYGPSTGQMMQNDRVINQMDETIQETYERRIEHEINRILSGWGG